MKLAPSTKQDVANINRSIYLFITRLPLTWFCIVWNSVLLIGFRLIDDLSIYFFEILSEFLAAAIFLQRFYPYDSNSERPLKVKFQIISTFCVQLVKKFVKFRLKLEPVTKKCDRMKSHWHHKKNFNQFSSLKQFRIWYVAIMCLHHKQQQKLSISVDYWD